MKKIITLIVTIIATATLHAQIPVAFYPLNGNANDTSANGFNGILSGTLSSDIDRFGNSGKALAFNGSTRIDVTDNSLLRPINVTLSAWVYYNSSAGTKMIASKNLCGGTAESFGIFIVNGSIGGSWSDGSSTNFISAPAPTVSQWHLVTFVYDDDNNMASLYLDGLLATSQTSTLSLGYDNSTFSIGYELESCVNSFFYDGSIDEVKIYNTALTATQVLDEFNLPNPFTTFYEDFDNDTYGNLAVSILAPSAPSGYVANSLDCNDSVASIHPGAAELCNGIDDNCNGQIDEGVVIPQLFTNKPTAICQGENITLTTSIPASIEWSTGQLHLTSIVVDTAGTFWVKDYTTNCQSAQVTITVNPLSATPVITANGSTNLCNGDFVSLKSSTAAQYFWSYSTQFTSNNAAGNTDSIVVPYIGFYRTYSVITIDTGFVCPSLPSNAITVTAGPFAIAPTINVLGGVNQVCYNDTNSFCILQTSLPGGGSLLWSNGATTTTILVGKGNYSVKYITPGGCQSAPSNNVQITERAAVGKPIISTPNGTSTCGGSFVIINANGNATNYQWSNGQFGNSLFVTTSGYYSVIGYDNNGCQSMASDSVLIKINPATVTPTITANGPLKLCNGVNLILTSTAAANYFWSNGETTQSITLTKGGEYYVITQDVNGCTAESNHLLVDNYPVAIIFSSTPLSFCLGDSVTLTSSLPTAELNYLWSNGATTKTIKVFTTETFTVIVTNSTGCTSTISTPVTVTASATSAPPTIYTYDALNACDGFPITLRSSSSTNNLWSNGATGQNNLVTLSGTYSVTTNNPGQCISGTSNSITVVRSAPAIPTITASGPTTFCEGDSVVLTSSNINRNVWSNGALTQSIKVKQGGTFTVSYTDSLGCLSFPSSAVQVLVIPNPNTPTISAFLGTSGCIGNTITLNSSQSLDGYLWSNGATTASITTSNAGSYTVITTNSFGCKSNESAPIVVTFNGPAKPTIQALGATTFCDGQLVMLSSSTAFNYLWNNQYQTKNISATTSGYYSVKAIDSNGCASEASDSILITVNALPAAPIITANGSTTICAGNPVLLSASTSPNYLWSNGITTQTINAIYGGTYSAKAISASGCASENSNSIGINVNTVNTIPFFQASTTNLCTGDSALLISSTSNNLLWSTGETTQSITVYQGGTYLLTVNDQQNCIVGVSTPTVITDRPLPATPVLTANGPTSFCAGGNVVLESSYTLGQNLWSDSVVTFLGPQRIFFNTQVVTVRAKDSGGFGCISAPSNAISVQSNPLPAAPVITASGAVNFCDGDSVTLTATPAHHYIWNNGATTQSIVVKTTGTYEMNVADVNGCVSPTSNFIVVISNSKPATPSINTFSQPTAFCNGGSMVLSAVTSVGNASFLWSSGQITNNITVSTSGDYYVTVLDQIGCASDTSMHVQVTVFPTPAKPIITLSGPSVDYLGNHVLCFGDTIVLTSSPAATYQWNNNTFLTDSSLTITSTVPLSFGGLNYSVVITDTNGCVSPQSESLNIGMQNRVNAIIGVGPNQSPIFCEGSGATLQANFLNMNYLWSNGQTTFSFPVDSSGVYTLTITDNIGCASYPSAPFTTTEILGTQVPQITASDKLDYCFGENISLTLTSSSPTDNVWTVFGQNFFTQSITVNAPATYTLNTFNNSNCIVGTTSVTIIQHGILATPLITASGPLDFCFGDSVILTSSYASGNLWSTGDTTQSILINASNLSPGSGQVYAVSYTDEFGCSPAFQGTVFVNHRPLPNAPIITPSDTVTICAGGSTNLSALNTANGYLWSNGETTQAIAVNTAGNYTLITTDFFGCPSAPAAPVTVIVSTITTWYQDADNDGFGNPSVSATLCTKPVGFVANNLDCDDSNGSIHPGATEICDNGVDDNCNGQIDESQIVINSVITNVTCKGNSSGAINITVINDNGSYQYLWNNGATTASIANLHAGKYKLTVTNNCKSKVYKFVVTEPALGMLLTGTKKKPKCSTGATGTATVVVSGGISPYAYLWSNGQTTTTATGLAGGAYMVTVTDGSGCTRSMLFMLVAPQGMTVAFTTTNPTIAQPASGQIIATVSGGTPNYVYLWNTSPLKTTATITGLNAGTYMVKVTDKNMCTTISSVALVNVPTRLVNSLDDELISIAVMPNPSDGLFNLKVNSVSESRALIELMDVTGRVVLTENMQLIGGDNAMLLDAQAMPKGIYLLRFTLDDKLRTLRIIIQ